MEHHLTAPAGGEDFCAFLRNSIVRLRRRAARLGYPRSVLLSISRADTRAVFLSEIIFSKRAYMAKPICDPLQVETTIVDDPSGAEPSANERDILFTASPIDFSNTPKRFL
jgi:hypothetical protein